MFDLRLIRFDALQLRRRKGMVSIAILLTAGITLLIYAVTALQHASNPVKYGPAGGVVNYHESISFLLSTVLVAAAIVGATAGAADLESGVFRDLAATGRSRLALFASRTEGAWVVVLPIAALTAVLTTLGAFVLAGSAASPSAGTVIGGTAALLAAGAFGAVVSVGLAALVGSRGPVIAIMLAFLLAISPVLADVSFLGSIRDAIPTQALERLAGLSKTSLHIPLGVGITVVVGWMLAAFAAGAWRTSRQEI
jgi:ABC-type transport system involved in multi-copper enzyme maturation permease subunit